MCIITTPQLLTLLKAMMSFSSEALTPVRPSSQSLRPSHDMAGSRLVTYLIISLVPTIGVMAALWPSLGPFALLPAPLVAPNAVLLTALVIEASADRKRRWVQRGAGAAGIVEASIASAIKRGRPLTGLPQLAPAYIIAANSRP